MRDQAEDFRLKPLEIPMDVTPSRFPAEGTPGADAGIARAGIGQGEVKVTPLQMAMVAAAIANDGVQMAPYTVETIRNPDLDVVRQSEPRRLRTSVSPSTAEQLTQMMVGVVQNGSGKAAQIPGVQVAGKTGTAETGGEAAPHAWFTSFAPADDPQVAVAVIVENGGSMGNEATGGAIAAPIARAVMEAVLERMKPVRGLTLGNRYRLVRRIAVGGMGEVWVAADDALGREVAVKVLRSEYAGNEDFLNRLRTEARNSAALSHPNIAQMYDYGETNGSGYLVMELVVGEPMADLLEREPVLPPARLLPILAQTARALHAAHLSGVVHRDVKPGNILIDRSGTVKITDFGVSLAANQVPMTATGMVMGTAQYLSPEQAVGQAATGASDIYALGIVAYESIAGNRRFTGSTPVDIAVAHVNEPVPPLPTSVDPESGGARHGHARQGPAGAAPPGRRARARLRGHRRAPRERPLVRPHGGARPHARRARRARPTADDVPAPEPDPAPVITPLVIPAAVRDPHATDPANPWVAPEPRRAAHAAHADVPPPSAATPPGPPDDDATRVRPLGRHGGTVPATAEPVPAPPAPDDAAPGPALPWERPVPAAPADDPAAPRSYPPRREMHGPTRSSRRPQPTRAGTRPAGAPRGLGGSDARRARRPGDPRRGPTTVAVGTRAVALRGAPHVDHDGPPPGRPAQRPDPAPRRPPGASCSCW